MTSANPLGDCELLVGSGHVCLASLPHSAQSSAWHRAGLRHVQGCFYGRRPETSSFKCPWQLEPEHTHVALGRHRGDRERTLCTNLGTGGNEPQGEKSRFQTQGGILGIYIANNTQVRRCVNKAGSTVPKSQHTLNVCHMPDMNILTAARP